MIKFNIPIAHIKNSLCRSAILLIGLTFGLSLIPSSAFAVYPALENSFDNGIMYFNPDRTGLSGCSATTGSISGSGLQELDGYTLPAYSGQTGREQAIDDTGQITAPDNTGSQGRVSFPQHAALGSEYRDYYITMQWKYVSWAWNGSTKSLDPTQAAWMGAAPRLLLVTNPKTNKSIIAVALESGPGPSVGSTWRASHGNSSAVAPPYWQGYQDERPKEADGMVAGMPPVALDALGLTPSDIDPSYKNGGPTTPLIYSWAPDQSATPGPTSLDQSFEANAATSCNGSTTSGIVAGDIVETAKNFAWLQRKQNNGADYGINKDDAKPEYQAAVPKYNGSTSYAPYSDCGVFVSTVMRASGADPDFPIRGSGSMKNYMINSPKYQTFTPSSTADLRPGDIMAIDGHIYIYTGPFTGTDGSEYSILQASLTDHVPNAGQVFLRDYRGQYTAGRLINNE